MSPKKSPAEMYAEREKRVRDCIELRQPDRVPVLIGLGYLPMYYIGNNAAAAYYDVNAWKEANKKAILEIEPDLYRFATGNTSGRSLEALDAKIYKWPGFNLPSNVGHQFVEGEYIKENEYDQFFADPSDFMMRVYFPRVFGNLTSFAKLPPLRSMHGAALSGVAGQMMNPEFMKAFEAIYKAGQESARWAAALSTFDTEMEALGFPPQSQAGAMAPFDVVSDNLRGMRGAMIDMYRRPDRLRQLTEMYVQQSIDGAVNAAARRKGNPKRVFMALHRGAEGFMSNKQFETFYWPTLKKVFLALIENGLVPFPYFEGEYSSRLEYLTDLPKGKIICHFAYVDVPKAKALLGGKQCIMASVPSSLLTVGSPQEVEEFARKLIKEGGKDGGFMLTNGTTDEAKPANMKALVDAARKYGTY